MSYQENDRQYASNPSSEDLEEIKNRIEAAMKAEERNNKDFKDYWRYTFENCLTDNDKQVLEAQGKDTLSFNTLRPYVTHAMKNFQDSEASTYFESDSPDEYHDHPSIDNGTIARILNKKYSDIMDNSKESDVQYNIVMDACVGGKGIFRIKTCYINQYDFKQEIRMEAVEDPTMVYFDPSSKSETGYDGEFVIEKCLMGKDEFNRTFKKFDFDRLKNTYESSYGWFGMDKVGLEKICICDYYYKVYDEDILYELKDGSMTTDKPKNKKDIIRKRTLDKCKIWLCRLVGSTLLEDPKQTAFYSLPFVQVQAESYMMADGTRKKIPYAKHGFDTIRTKTFLLNYYINYALENNKYTVRIPEAAITDTLLDAIRDPSKGDVQIYKSHFTDNLGQFQPLPPIQDIPPQPLPQQLLEAATMLDQSLNGIFGMQFPSIDEQNLSGKALYNLAQYISASNVVLMQNYYKALTQVANVILGAMESIIEEENINLDNGKSYQFDYIFEPSRYKIVIKKGVSHKLQQEATIERMLDMAKISPLFAEFLNTAPVIEFLLENQDLNNKYDIIHLWEQFPEQQKQMAQQPNPQQQLLQEEIMAKQMSAKAKMMDATTKAQQLQLEMGKHIIDKKSQKEQNNIELLKISSQNTREKEDNMIKVAEMANRHKQYLMNHARDIMNE
ncbi:MAG TPA: hypothetical protein VFV86_12575 [Nitrososphaeraceae archaeon]|nr:hypothetical protein [Nitrososphaeraceae archaeon]